MGTNRQILPSVQPRAPRGTTRTVEASLPPTVAFWGAAHTVTGSMHLVQFGRHQLLLDCGLFQGSRAVAYERNRHFPFWPGAIDAVILSHAHIDHCGNLPNLVRQGFEGPIYCTPATKDLTAIMLGDSAKIQEEDANYLNQRRNPGDPRGRAALPSPRRPPRRRPLPPGAL
jgi:metallo-beta-lactamase family protein